MPFADKMHANYKQLVTQAMQNAVLESPDDFDLFERTIKPLFDDNCLPPANRKFGKVFDELNWIFRSFDKFGTAMVIEQTIEIDETDENGCKKTVAFFTSDKETVEERLADAKREYKLLIIDAININLGKLSVIYRESDNAMINELMAAADRVSNMLIASCAKLIVSSDRPNVYLRNTVSFYEVNMPTISKFLMGYSSNSDALKNALQLAGLTKDHFVMDQGSGEIHINTEGTLLSAKLETNSEGDISFYSLYYESTLIAMTTKKAAAYEHYYRMRVTSDALLTLPVSLIGEKQVTESKTTGYENIPDLQISQLVFKHPGDIQNVAKEAINRALIDPSKKYLVMNVIGACANKSIKEEIEQNFDKALQNNNVSLTPTVKQKECTVDVSSLAKSMSSVIGSQQSTSPAEINKSAYDSPQSTPQTESRPSSHGLKQK